MFGVVPASDAPIERNQVQLHYIRQGSIVRDEFGASVEDPGINMAQDPDHLEDEAENVRQGLRANRQDVREEREQFKKDDNIRDRINTNNYGWAYDQMIMIRPIFDIYFKNMPLKRVGFC